MILVWVGGGSAAEVWILVWIGCGLAVEVCDFGLDRRWVGGGGLCILVWIGEVGLLWFEQRFSLADEDAELKRHWEGVLVKRGFDFFFLSQFLMEL